MTQALIPLEPNHLLTPRSTSLARLEAMLAEAAVYVKSGLLPASVNTPEKAVLIMATGHELGIPPTYALRNVHVIQGRPTCSAELMMALVQRDHGRDALRVIETDAAHCTVVVRDGSHTARFTWTLDDARAAGLLARDTWKQYPRAMLRSRAVSEAARATFPGSIGGLYTAEELGSAVAVGADDAIDLAPEPAAAPRKLAAFVPSPRITTVSEFWAAAHALLGCSPSQLATRVAHLLGEEAAAMKARERLTWAELYGVLQAEAVEAPPPPEDEPPPDDDEDEPPG